MFVVRIGCVCCRRCRRRHPEQAADAGVTRRRGHARKGAGRAEADNNISNNNNSINTINNNNNNNNNNNSNKKNTQNNRESRGGLDLCPRPWLRPWPRLGAGGGLRNDANTQTASQRIDRMVNTGSDTERQTTATAGSRLLPGRVSLGGGRSSGASRHSWVALITCLTLPVQCGLARFVGSLLR